MGRAIPEIWGPLGPKDKIVRGVEPNEIADMFIREQRAYESIVVRQVREALMSLDMDRQTSTWGNEKW